ncbi:hypothetical protein BDZ97DRAFT_984209 [Flammula alnicola]|nr:hypothetical protein BDZ97DRAFT_984209 [Flammula alnicola]
MIDDSLVGWDLDTLEQSASASSASTMPQLQQDSTLSLDFLENSSNPQLKALSARMKVALKTTDELTKFWIKRGAIEQQYASRLANLAETMIGEHESSDLRSAIDGLRVETAKQAMNRYELAKQIAVELESRCVELQLKQSTHWHDLYEPAARKLHNDQVRESRRRSGVASEWKKEYKKLRYSLDTRRLESMKANLNYRDFSMNSKGGNNFASEFDSPSGSSLDSQRMSAGWIKEWEALRDSCEQLEVDRSQLMKDVLRVFSDTLSVIRATDHESIETINLSNDLFRPEDFVEEFCQNFGSRTSAPGTPKARHARVQFPSENLTEESSITPSSTFHSSASFRPLPPPPSTVTPRPCSCLLWILSFKSLLMPSFPFSQ